MFKYTADLAKDENEDEVDGDEDEATSSEIALLEKVVSKLATMAELTAKKQPDVDTEGMREEDIGILNMIRGSQGIQPGGPGGGGGDNAAWRDSRLIKRAMTVNMKVEELGVSMDTFYSWDFDPLELTKEQRIALSGWLLVHHQGCSNFVRDSIPEPAVHKFCNLMDGGYYDNPYHCFAHAVDVMHTAARIMTLSHADLFLGELEQFAVLVSGLGHDVGHPGVNNPFLIETGHELTLRYNDRSPLENMHCAKLYEVVAEPGAGIFANLPKDQYG